MSHRMHRAAATLAALGLTLLSGCNTSEPIFGGGGNDDGAMVPASTMDLTISSPAPNVNDGLPTTDVRATVFIPAHVQGARYPLIVHSHGWGGSRVSAADLEDVTPEPGSSMTSYFTLIDQRVKTLWDAGYAVISFTERGHGRGGDDDDEGTADGAHTMSPDYEIRDAMAVIDWAVEHLDLELDGPGDPKIGTIGGSYGGGFQLLLAAFDPRVDALIPGATWHSLEQSLGPNRVIKKGYSFGLCLLATTDMIELSEETRSSCEDGAFNQSTRFTEELSPLGVTAIREHALSFLAQDPGFVYPRVDALLIQGNRDILFDLGQSIGNYEYLSRWGGDVRMVTHDNGHSLRALRQGPGSQGPLGSNMCGDIDAMALYKAWFDAKLKGDERGIAALPRVCLALDDTRAAHLAAPPRGDAAHSVTIPATTVTGAVHNNTQTAAEDAAFVPLGAPVAAADLVLAGTPEALITVSSPAPGVEGVAFIGIGVRRGGETILVDDQVVPVRSSDERAGETPTPIDLVAVGEKLEEGDEVGVLLYADHDQFENEARSLYPRNAVTVSGTVKLPIVSPPVHTRAASP